MNRTEAKTYALEVLGLDREQVRAFGNLNRTQTWLDAIAAQASEGIAAQASEGIAALEAAPEPLEAIDPIETTETPEISPEVPSVEVTSPEDSLLAFWEAEPEPVVAQPLACLPELDAAWEDSKPAAPAPVVYPVVIALMMLWALVQLLLLGGKALCWLLTGAGQWLDELAQKRLQRQRETGIQPEIPKLVLAVS